ncbi:circadian clock protein KaiC [Aquincola sp. S2]|uniref:non-specific serine/threonine protein kinase n=2 Tax=Pseudaquabacterium terrae TaxID=2732868 RepID=A0ABX2ERD2_9BURK|nr:circadian clock protein KaiC [Aquabacterium terrae]
MTTGIEKCPTGIPGLDEITAGGLPRGRPTLVCGGAGCGKTLLGMEFLIRGALDCNEPGVFVTFEETPPELTRNVASLGVDLDALVASGRMAIKHIQLDRSEIEVAGDYDLEGLFIQLGNAIDSVGARRIVLDTIETLFGSFPNETILRAELQRLFRWLKARGLTAVITGERGDRTYTRHGLEEYVADCVIVLDHRIVDQIATRRVRVVKYRGSVHGPDEYPFLIDADGISVLPITSLNLTHAVSSERVPSGVHRLDALLGGGGYYRGSSILVSGTAGTGKSSLAASFVDAACRRGERCLYLALEESPAQIVRNMRSIGIDLQPWVDGGKLQILPSRSTACGLELHLATIHRAVNRFHPQVVVIDPISNLTTIGSALEVRAMLTRLIDFLKSLQITALFTSLNHAGNTLEATDTHISSLADTWLLLRDVESNGERNRLLYLLKSRGMAHSNQMREFLLTDRGIELRDVYLGTAGVLTGTARQVQESTEKAETLVRAQEVQARRRDIERRREVVEARILMLRAESAAEMLEAETLIAQAERSEVLLETDRSARATLRKDEAAAGERA